MVTMIFFFSNSQPFDIELFKSMYIHSVMYNVCSESIKTYDVFTMAEMKKEWSVNFLMEIPW